MSFVPLRVRSHGSLLCGTASPEALVERALRLGYGALALTDRDNLYLAIRFWQHARAEGLTPLPGAEIVHESGAALLIPVDRRGWANLCAVLTARHLDPRFDLVRALAAAADGLHAIVESPGLAGALLAAGLRAAGGHGLARPPADPGAPGVWLGVRGLGAERAGLAARLKSARWLGVPPVATGDVVLLAPADHEAHRAAVTAAAGELLERMPKGSFCAPEAWLAAPPEWARRVRAVCAGGGAAGVADALLANNAALARRCRLELELGTPIFPRAPVPGGESRPGWLEKLGLEGVTRRYGAGAAARAPAVARLREELGIIDRLGFTDYFLLVADIVGFARARGIPTVGRGSGAGSLVAYALGITNVDPLRYGLYFERFLHPQRRDCPDLDIDLCWRRRDEVIAHVYATYGDDRVAMISTHATLGARSAFRETAKALGVPAARVDRLARRVPRELEKPYLEHLLARPEARGVDWREPPLADALRLAERLDGAPRHLSIHAGGVVIGDRPLAWYVPLERAAKGIVVTQFEMRAIEAIGLVKMDLLGNRALTTIGECVSLVAARAASEGRSEPPIDVDRLPDPDPLASPSLAAGDTLACFQVESPAMRHLLRMVEARTLDDTIAAVALVRPGPAESGMKEAFCRRRRGLEPATYLHPRLEPALRATHGVLLYEEDVLAVAAALLDLPLAEGDLLRRAIGAARTEPELRSLEHGFVARAGAAGIELDTARAVWRDLARFASYAFCKAHAAGYGALAYQSAWLKAHHPVEYAVGVLNHHAGMYDTWVHVEDLRRHGVRFRAPCARRSAWDATLELADGAAVRVGLSRVFGLHESTAARLAAARQRRPFASLADLVARAAPARPELEALILAGALDWTGRTRPALLLEARVTAARARPARVVEGAPVLAGADGAELLPDPRAPFAIPELPEFDLAARVRGECGATGLWFAAHPLDVWLDAAERVGATPAAELPGRAGRRTVLVGLPCARRTVETRQGGLMLFLTIADASGVAECVLFPDSHRRLADAARGGIVRVEGRVDDTYGALTLVVEEARALCDRDGGIVASSDGPRPPTRPAAGRPATAAKSCD